MRQITQQEIIDYVEENIPQFHQSRLTNLLSLELEDVLKRKNPYLFKAKNINTAEEFVRNILEAFLSSSEEGLFGGFLEGLAIFICGRTVGGRKSATKGIDLEFEIDDTKYIVSIKSGPNWGNDDQIKKMKDNFKAAKKTLRTNAPSSMKVIAVNGCCYGRDNKPDKGEYLKLCGQSFWTLISGHDSLYTEIIEPLGHKAKEKNEQFMQEYAKMINRFSYEFIQNFCDSQGQIRWEKIVQLNSSRRLDLELYPIARELEKNGNLLQAAELLEDVCMKGTSESKIHKKLSKILRKLYKGYAKTQNNEEAIEVLERIVGIYRYLKSSDNEDFQVFAPLYLTLTDARILLKIAHALDKQGWTEVASELIEEFKKVKELKK